MNALDEITQLTWDILQDRIQDTLVTGIRGMVDGAEEDLRAFGYAIAGDMVQAVMRGDVTWEKEVRAQALLLLEMNRLRAVNANYALLMQTIHAIVRMGLEVAGTLVGGMLKSAIKGE